MLFQCASSVLMVRPAAFGFNTETAESNAFQNQPSQSQSDIQAAAQLEFDTAVETLRQAKIRVEVAEDTPQPVKPDAIFPNNWVSFHPNGTVILYPMATPNRRLERRSEIIDKLKKSYKITAVEDLHSYEDKGQILEGTGSIVFDHPYGFAYACLSARTHSELFEEIVSDLGYEPISFQAKDAKGTDIYHTNVMLSIGEHFAVICPSSIADDDERSRVLESLKSSGKEVIDVTFDQMNQFACNVLEVQNQDGKPYLVMSKTAYQAFSASQKEALAKHAQLLPVSIPTIENVGGGSARCMMAEIFCKPL